jgi:hypothetical protein
VTPFLEAFPKAACAASCPMESPFGTFSDMIDTEQPWPVKLPIGPLTPRYL